MADKLNVGGIKWSGASGVKASQEQQSRDIDIQTKTAELPYVGPKAAATTSQAAASAERSRATLPADVRKANADADAAELARDAALKKTKEQTRDLEAAQTEIKNVIRNAQAAKRMSARDFFATGFGASTMAKWGGSPAADVNAKLEVIGANTAFERLQKIKKESPNGGGLGGNTSDADMKLLKNSVAALDPTQSDEEFQKSMDDIIANYTRVYDGLTKQRLADVVTGNQKARGYRLAPEDEAVLADYIATPGWTAEGWAQKFGEAAKRAGVNVDDAFMSSLLTEGQRIRKDADAGAQISQQIDYSKPDKQADTEMSMPAAIAEGALNLPVDVVKQYANTGKALTVNLPETASGIANLLGDALGITDGKTLAALGQHYAERYGSAEGFKKALAESPAEVLSDLSAVTGGVGALAKTGPLSKLSDVSRALDPAALALAELRVPTEAAGMAARGVKEAAAAIPGTTSGAGAAAVKEAVTSGRIGGARGATFRENMRGGSDYEGILSNVREALANIRQQASQAYKSGMLDVSKDKTILDFEPIDKRLDALKSRAYYKGEIRNPSAAKVYERAKEIIDDWRGMDPKEYHTPEGMDALKQRLGDLDNEFSLNNDRRASSIATGLYKEVRGAVAAQVPTYAKTMKAYEEAAKLTNDIERTLSLKPDAPIDASLRKLQSIMRNNANTNYGRREALAGSLENAGADKLLPSMAGQAFNSLTPRGLGSITAGAGIVGSTVNPASLLTLPLTSPRAVGEMAHGIGRGLGAMDTVTQPVVGSLRSAAQPFQSALPALMQKYGQARLPLTALNAGISGLTNAQDDVAARNRLEDRVPQTRPLDLGVKGRYDPETDTYILSDGTRVRADGTVIE